MMRLQKFLSQAGIASRRKAEDLIRQGQITINNELAKIGSKVDPQIDTVKYKNKIIKPNPEKIYIALNKPIGYVSSTVSNHGKSVINLIKSEQKLYPVGRLDKDSGGLLLLTNDGDLAQEVTHAKFNHEKEYFVVLDKDLKTEDIHRLERGITLREKKLRPVKIVMAKNKSARIKLHEGGNRQIRRMLGKLGYTVIKLKRIRIGRLELGDLKPGQWKKIKKKEIF